MRLCFAAVAALLCFAGPAWAGPPAPCASDPTHSVKIGAVEISDLYCTLAVASDMIAGDARHDVMLNTEIAKLRAQLAAQDARAKKLADYWAAYAGHKPRHQ